jgi:hypothetical protein
MINSLVKTSLSRAGAPVFLNRIDTQSRLVVKL